jgi:hypothetical protein
LRRPVPFEEDTFDREPITATLPEPEERDSWTAIPPTEWRSIQRGFKKQGIRIYDDGDVKRTNGALRMAYQYFGRDPQRLIEGLDHAHGSGRGIIYAALNVDDRDETWRHRCQ